MNLTQVKDKLLWDCDLTQEFSNPHRSTGYTFVIDLYAGQPQLTLYHMGPFGSHTDSLPQQPPQELLLQALQELRVDSSADGLFTINQTLRTWIEENLLK